MGWGNISDVSTLSRAGTTADTIRAALYQRVSTKDQDTERQNQENRAAAGRNGWHVTEYADPGESASRFAGRNGGANRDGYRRLMAAVAAGQVDVLVFWDSARGSRELEGWAGLLNACRRTGTLVHITRDGRTYDPAVGRDWRSLAEDGVSAAYFSEELCMAIRSGKASGLRAGRPQGQYRVRDPPGARPGADPARVRARGGPPGHRAGGRPDRAGRGRG